MRIWTRLLLLVAALAAPELAHAAANFDAQAATDAYVATLSSEAKEKSDAYFEGKYFLSFADTLYVIAVAALLMWTGMSTRMRNMARRATRFRGLQTFIYVLFYMVATAALTFPFSYYTEFVREHQYGLSNLDFGEWFVEFLISVVVTTILFGLLVTGVYRVIRSAPRTWWIWGAAISIVGMAAVIVIAPVAITPLFNEFTKLEDGPLKDEIVALAHANGVPADDVYVFNLSEQTDKISANVSGFLGTTRISLADNLLERGTREEIRAVVAHEIGHYVLGHSLKFLVYNGIMLFVGFAFVHWGLGALLRRYGSRWGVEDQADPAGLPVFVALLTLFFTFMIPVRNSMIRENEAQADLFGINASREPDGWATAAMKLAEYRKIDPAPWEEIVFYDHPSGRSRVAMAMQWKAGHIHEPDIAAKPSPGQ